MLDSIYRKPAVKYLKQFISESREIVLTCHVSPDGDAVGSVIALQRVLRRLGKRVWVITPDMPPRSLSFLPGLQEIIPATQKPERAAEIIARANLIVCLDFNTLSRVDKLAPAIEASPARKALIDHHLHPDDFAEVTISRPDASSTCYLLYHVIRAMGYAKFIDRLTADAIYTGMMTDTGGFAYNSNDPGLYEVIADLLHRGTDKDRIYKHVFNTESENRLRLCGYALYKKMVTFPQHKCALITLSRSELKEFGYSKGDTESLVNRPLSMPDVMWSVFMRQDDENFVKVSTRSKGRFPVNTVCETLFGGGGHVNAAGGEFYGSLDDAVRILVEAMPQFDEYIPEKQR